MDRPGFTRSRQKARTLPSDQPEEPLVLSATDGLEDECDELSHLGSSNRSTLCVLVKT